MKSKILILILLTLSLISCKPRGETKTLQEVLNLASEQFQEKLQNKDLKNMKDKVVECGSLLESLIKNANSDSARTLATQISNSLGYLIEAAGYTSRPSLTELEQQFRVLSTTPGTPMEATIKLLVARAYNTLASEIEGVGFQLREREMK